MAKTKLPPLASLRAFDSVARLTSLKEAANELSLTVSAVSHQIRNLEEHLGIPLLRRRGRGVELTPPGAKLAAHVHRAFSELHHGVRGVLEDPKTLELRVSVTPVFGTEMLMPRLAEFERQHPGLRVRLEMSEALADFSDEQVDVAVRAGLPPAPSLYSEELFALQVTPVCAPRLLEGAHALRRVTDLSAQTLICLSNQPEVAGCWRWWAAAAGCDDFSPTREVWFDTYAAALHAAERGVGVVLAPDIILGRYLRERRLVAPFPVFVSLPWVYRFVCRRGHEQMTKIRLFRQWMKTSLRANSEPPRPLSGMSLGQAMA